MDIHQIVFTAADLSELYKTSSKPTADFIGNPAEQESSYHHKNGDNYNIDSAPNQRRETKFILSYCRHTPAHSCSYSFPRIIFHQNQMHAFTMINKTNLQWKEDGEPAEHSRRVSFGYNTYNKYIIEYTGF